MLVLTPEEIQYCQIGEPNSIPEKTHLGIRYRGMLFVQVASFATTQFKQALAKCRQFLDRDLPITSIILKETNSITVWSQAPNNLSAQCGIDSDRILIKHKLPELARIDLQTLVEKMRGLYGIEIKDRWFNFKLYRQCFTGNDGVNWFRKHQKLSKEAAIELGKILVKQKIIHHVYDEHDFKNDFLFYRFYEDENFIANSTNN